MPPVGWLKLRDRMMSEAFNVFGQRAGRAKGSLHRAVKRISLGLATLEAHPAFRDAALPGEVDTVFLAWPDHEQMWSPYPTGQRPRILLPTWSTVGGIRVTMWWANLEFAYEDPMFNPAEHVRFIEPGSASQ